MAASSSSAQVSSPSSLGTPADTRPGQTCAFAHRMQHPEDRQWLCPLCPSYPADVNVADTDVAEVMNAAGIAYP
jgi:hypothetical protein